MPQTMRSRLIAEAVGVLLVASWAVIALGHALAGAKRDLLLDDGDSVLLPLMVQSAHRGLAVEWGMSPVLFVFPELPLYVLSSVLTSTVAASLLFNGVLNLVLLYALLRLVAGRARPRLRGARETAPHGSWRAVAAALVGVAAFTILCLLESRPGGNTAEVASLFLTTTYYSGTVMALVSATGLVLHVVDLSSGGVGRRIRLPLIALALLSALATFSNPLYVLWVTGPIVVALTAVTFVRRRAGLPALAAAVLVAASAVGYVARTPLQRFIIADKTEYLRWHGQRASAQFFADAGRALVETPGGEIEAVLLVALVVVPVVVAVRRLRARRTDPSSVAALIALTTVIVVPAGLLVTGSLSTRYALPLLFAPLVALVALVASTRNPAPVRTQPDIARRRLKVGVAVVVATALATAGAVVPTGGRVLAAGRASGDPGSTCLTQWTRGKDVAGATQFWLGRGLAAYGGPDVRLLQVNYDLSVYPWLVNLAAYRDARVGYVLVATGETPGGHGEGWGDSVAELGTPRDVVHCDGFDIVDFRGTSGETRLTDAVDSSARVQAALRGFDW